MSHTTYDNQAHGVLPDGNQRSDSASGSTARGNLTSAEQERKGRRVYEYQPGSWWSHLLYGLGMLAFLVVPPLLPGTKVTELIKGYMGFLVISLGIVCVWGIWRTLYIPARGKPTKI